jgi:hypothetical protein
MKRIILACAVSVGFLMACNTSKNGSVSQQSQQFAAPAVSDAPKRMTEAEAQTTQPKQGEAQLLQTSDRVLTKKVKGKSMEAQMEAAFSVPVPDTAR